LRHDADEGWFAQSADGSSPLAGDRIRAALHAWLQSEATSVSVARLALAADLRLPGEGFVAAAINCQGCCVGAVVCAVPSDQQEAAATFLAVVAERLGALLIQEASERASREERERLAWLGNVSELTSIVSHEFNNLLNGILLHVAVLKQDVPKEMQSELDVIRGLGNNAALLIKQLQKYNSKRRGSLQPVDLNQLVRDAVAERQAREPALTLQVDLDPELPPAQAKPFEVGRLLSLLIDQARAAMGSHPGPISIRTLRAGNRPQLHVEDVGPPIDETLLPRIFEPFTVVRPGGDEAALAVCHTLVRHLHASMRAENRPAMGVAFTIEFTPAAK
jgi:signal transduction histidine kinase